MAFTSIQAFQPKFWGKNPVKYARYEARKAAFLKIISIPEDAVLGYLFATFRKDPNVFIVRIKQPKKRRHLPA
jgi:hypothetical protein